MCVLVCRWCTMEVKNTKLLTYRIKVSKRVSNRVRWMGYRDTQCLGVVIYNLLACIRKRNVLVYSRRIMPNASVSPKGITTRRVIRAVDFLEREGYVINHIGRGSAIAENRRASWIEPTQKFLDEWTDQTVYMTAEIDYLEQCEVIELRDKNKNAIPYRNSEHIKRMSETVRELNKMNESHVVVDKDGETLSNIYCRIFNESFGYGGRFYRADVLAIKNKETDDRLRITIDGGGVCEVDYSNLHFRIAAALEDLDAEDIPLDVYSGLLEDESNGVDREIVKLSVNMMFNCMDEGSAMKAIQKEINLMEKDKKSQYTLGNAESVMSLIREAYPDFVHLFCTKSSYGRILQNADSHLASDVIDQMLLHGVPCLPVHDSFIVPVEHLNLLCDTMGECFRKRFNWDGIVPVGLKYIDNGNIVSEKICV